MHLWGSTRSSRAALKDVEIRRRVTKPKITGFSPSTEVRGAETLETRQMRTYDIRRLEYVVGDISWREMSGVIRWRDFFLSITE